jgi:hypothetical protein
MIHEIEYTSYEEIKMNSKRKIIASLVLAAAAAMGSVNIASATTWNFGGAFANLGPDEVLTVGSDSLTAAAFTYAEPSGVATYTAATLIRRNQAPDDIGFGCATAGMALDAPPSPQEMATITRSTTMEASAISSGSISDHRRPVCR